MDIHMKDLAKMIDHTLLDPRASRDSIRELCDEAKAYSVYAVCVNSAWVRVAVDLLRASSVKVSSTVGFPLGASLPEAKAVEASTAVGLGAAEVDMVINIGALKSKDHVAVREDISQVVKACKGSPVKVIVETPYLSEQEKIQACRLAEEAGAAFVKTSTGFSPGGATVEDVILIRRTVGNRLGVKAAGGIRTLKDALEMIEAGATRIGTSNTVQILNECPV